MVIQYPAPEAEKIKVCRDGPRGWHWIAAAHYDPEKHQIYTEQSAPDVEAVEANTNRPRRTRRKPK